MIAFIVHICSFWWSCLITGLSLGKGVSSYATLLCIIVWFWYRPKKHAEFVKRTDERIKQAAKWGAMIVLAVSTLVYAPFEQYRTQKNAREKAEADLADRAPYLRGEIDQYMVADELGKTNSLFFLQVSIGNAGLAPSVASHYQFKVVLTNNVSIDGDELNFADEYKLNALKGDSIIPFTLKRSELISEKTSKAIQPGESPRGWIAFRIPGMSLASHKLTNCDSILSFWDVKGVKISVTNNWMTESHCKRWEDQDLPRLLPGSDNLRSPSEPIRSINEVLSGPWAPPPLEEGCTNVMIFFGGGCFTFPLSLARISSTGTKMAIKDVPEFLWAGTETMTNYSPRQRNMWLKLQDLEQDFGGVKVTCPILPIVQSNRLYIEVEVPFASGRRRLIMSDDFDTELSNLPRNWDRNYSTNAFSYVYEIVNEHTNPVLQVAYARPNEVHINGIFVVATNRVLESFGESPQLRTLSSYRFIDMLTGNEITNAIAFIGTNSVATFFTNAFYDMQFPGQKAIFKYPSNRNPGVFAQ